MKNLLLIFCGIMNSFCFSLPEDEFYKTPNDGFHRHIPSLMIIAAENWQRPSFFKHPLLYICYQEPKNVSLPGDLSEHMRTLSEDRAANLNKASYDICYKKVDPNEVYIQACCKGDDTKQFVAGMQFLESRFVAESLIKHGVGCGNDRAVALQWAASTGHEEALLLLIDHSPEVVPTAVLEVKNNCPLRMAALFGLSKAVERLLQNVSNNQNQPAVHAENDAALCNAASRGFTDIQKMLLAYGADVNARDGHVLQMAVRRGDVHMVDWLLRVGADPTLQDNQAIKHAVAEMSRTDVDADYNKVYAQIVALLRQHGARA